MHGFFVFFFLFILNLNKWKTFKFSNIYIHAKAKKIILIHIIFLVNNFQKNLRKGIFRFKIKKNIEKTFSLISMSMNWISKKNFFFAIYPAQNKFTCLLFEFEMYFRLQFLLSFLLFVFVFAQERKFEMCLRCLQLIFNFIDFASQTIFNLTIYYENWFVLFCFFPSEHCWPAPLPFENCCDEF